MKGRALILILVLSVLQSVHAQNVGVFSGSNSVVAPTNLQKDTCYECHVGLKDAKMSDPAKAWEESVHKENDITCERCHSPVVPSGRLAAVGEYGGSYRDDHADMRLDVEFRAPAAYPIEGAKGEYTLTVRKGLNTQQQIAMCARCHGLSPQDPESPNDVFPLYKSDVHGQAAMVNLGNPNKMAAMGLEAPVSEDSKDAAVCTDCHDSHKTKKAKDITLQEKVTSCSGGVEGEKCHSSDAVSEKYGLVNAYETYLDTHHGKALSLGKENVPGCSDCHTSHSVLKADNPEATISAKKRADMCGQEDCHATKLNVALGSMHFKDPVSIAGVSPSLLIKLFYSAFIPVVVGFFTLYVVTDFLKSITGRGGE